jgi:hypothetical protein
MNVRGAWKPALFLGGAYLCTFGLGLVVFGVFESSFLGLLPGARIYRLVALAAVSWFVGDAARARFWSLVDESSALTPSADT